MNEVEQLEMLKSYWNRYGTQVTALVLVVVVGFFAWTKWQEKKEQDRERASAYYETFLASLERQNKAAAKAEAKHILTSFPDSPYALFTTLTLAKNAVEEHQLDEAILQLEKAVVLAKNTPLQPVTKLRLARVWLAKKEPQKALQTLVEAEPGLYKPLYEEIKGDCYLAEGKQEDARKAYRAALAAGLPGMPKNTILQMKLDSLGG